VQQRAFYRGYQVLVKNEIINTSSNILSLSPFFDESGLMRVGGRLKNSNLAFNACHSILLLRKHVLTQCIIEREHTKLTRGFASDDGFRAPALLAAIIAIHCTWNNTEMYNLF